MFNKKRCIDNIYALAKAKGLKIGDIEEKAGVSKGYLSRINKDNSASVPTVDLLESIAEQLEVGIDYLVNFQSGILTPNEEFVFRFVDRLSKQTIAGRMDWVVESASVLTAENEIEVENPLITVSTQYSPEFEVEYPVHMYTSRIYSGYAQVVDNCFHSSLPDGKSVVYLNAVKYNAPHAGQHTDADWSDRIIEVYILQGETRPICSTFYLRSELKKAVEDLYTAAASSPSHICLEQSTKDIMNAFLESFEIPK